MALTHCKGGQPAHSCEGNVHNASQVGARLVCQALYEVYVSWEWWGGPRSSGERLLLPGLGLALRGANNTAQRARTGDPAPWGWGGGVPTNAAQGEPAAPWGWGRARRSVGMGALRSEWRGGTSDSAGRTFRSQGASDLASLLQPWHASASMAWAVQPGMRRPASAMGSTAWHATVHAWHGLSSLAWGCPAWQRVAAAGTRPRSGITASRRPLFASPHISTET